MAPKEAYPLLRMVYKHWSIFQPVFLVELYIIVEIQVVTGDMENQL